MFRWPNFFIVGAPKAGTSSLYSYLREMPGIYMSKLKEPNYFSRVVVADDHPTRPIRDEQKYLKLFADAGDEKVLGEASPTYLADPEAPGLINQVAPQSKILISLRDPVERAYSHYLMMLNNGSAELDFLAEVKRGLENQEDRSVRLLRPETGLYHDQVERFFSVFGESRVKVIVFEEFVAEPKETVAQILEFLGVETSLDDFQAQVYRRFGVARNSLVRYLFSNRKVGHVLERLVAPSARKWIREKFLVKEVKKPEMDQDARQFLVRYYDEDVRKLSALLQRQLPWRNFPEVSPL